MERLLLTGVTAGAWPQGEVSCGMEVTAKPWEVMLNHEGPLGVRDAGKFIYAQARAANSGRTLTLFLFLSL